MPAEQPAASIRLRDGGCRPVSRPSCRLVLRVIGQWRVVQLAERRTLDPEVGGSIPPPPAGTCIGSFSSPRRRFSEGPTPDCQIARDESTSRNVRTDEASGSGNGSVTDRHAGKDDCTGPDPDVVANGHPLCAWFGHAFNGEVVCVAVEDVGVPGDRARGTDRDVIEAGDGREAVDVRARPDLHCAAFGQQHPGLASELRAAADRKARPAAKMDRIRHSKGVSRAHDQAGTLGQSDARSGRNLTCVRRGTRHLPRLRTLRYKFSVRRRAWR